MPNTLKNVVTGSLLRPPVNPWLVRMPGTDFGGIVDTTAAALGVPLDLGGSYLMNPSTDLKSADLRVPVCPVIVAAANADTWTLDVLGVNHLGEDVRETWTKVSAASAQVSRLAMHCYSKIKSITPIAASTIGNRLRIGHCFGQRTAGAGDLLGRTAATTVPGISRRLPLPYRPKSTSDVFVRYLGTEPGVSTVLVTVPIDTALTFNSSTVTLGTALGAATGLIGDVLYTADGYAGALTADATTTVFTVGAAGWYKNGVAGTPGNSAGAASTGYNALTIVRHNRLVVVSPTQGGLIPGGRVMPLAGTGGQATEVAGVHLNSATFGFLANDPAETPFDSLFEVSIRVGAGY